MFFLLLLTVCFWILGYPSVELLSVCSNFYFGLLPPCFLYLSPLSLNLESDPHRYRMGLMHLQAFHMCQRLLLTVTLGVCNVDLWKQYPVSCQSTHGPHLDCPFLQNQCLEFVRICGFFFVHSPQVFSGIMVMRGFLATNQNEDVLFLKPICSHFCLMVRYLSSWKKHCSLPNCSWMVAWNCSVLVPFMAVFLGYEAPSRMDSLRMLYCWHNTGQMVLYLFFSGQAVIQMLQTSRVYREVYFLD